MTGPWSRGFLKFLLAPIHGRTKVSHDRKKVGVGMEASILALEDAAEERCEAHREIEKLLPQEFWPHVESSGLDMEVAINLGEFSGSLVVTRPPAPRISSGLSDASSLVDYRVRLSLPSDHRIIPVIASNPWQDTPWLIVGGMHDAARDEVDPIRVSRPATGGKR